MDDVQKLLENALLAAGQHRLKYRFVTLSHPYVAQLLHALAEGSVNGLQAADTGPLRDPVSEFAQKYQPTELVVGPYPLKELDYETSGAYSLYNWELFFHIPITVAVHLSRNQRFEEAQRWFHHVFDPTSDEEGPAPARFWRFQKFRAGDVKLIEELLVTLASSKDPVVLGPLHDAIAEWKQSPFRPHAVARHRQSAYMIKTVTAYLDNLIAWGDSLFRQDTRESINEATQLYVLAASILGPRPQAVPRTGGTRPQTYADLRADLDAFGNALRELETDIPFAATPAAPAAPDRSGQARTLRGLGTLYFCVPRNDRLLAYWDTVADRLFKIHNSLNLQGVFRQLALFAPPIDPGLLARATAAGVDIGAAVNGADQPLPLVRCLFLLQKATEMCQEVKSLGAQLLAAIEKQDGEELAILRARHDRVMLKLGESIRYQQWQETIKAREGLTRALAQVVDRYTYYERLLGNDDVRIPEYAALDGEGLDRMSFAADEPRLQPRAVAVDIARDATDSSGLSQGKLVSSNEMAELRHLRRSQQYQESASSAELIASMLNLIPTFTADVKPIGLGAGLAFGGRWIASMLSMAAAADKAAAGRSAYQAGLAAKIGAYDRRQQEWAYQSNVAAGELNQVAKQLRAAEIREHIAERELRNHRQQIKHAEEIETFFAGKTTSAAFHAWTRREVRGLYGQAFQLAFDVARKAERALQRELGDPTLSFLRFGYLSGKEGLLAGERLLLDLKRMELAYHDLNQREYELTKHVSLLQADPIALLRLRRTGQCVFTLPEELYDLGGAGHYFRRIRSVAVSVPSVAGRYTGVNCELTLLKSTVRTSPALTDGRYAREGAEDPRFSDHFGSLETIVTSSGVNDGGVFDARDDRRLPFEGQGAVSEWRLRLPDIRQFDYDTIADVILHIRYTAREGGQSLRNQANAHLETTLAAGSVQLLSVRHEFPTAWTRFTRSKQPFGELTLDLRTDHYPFWSQTRLNTLSQIQLFAQTPDPVTVRSDPAKDNPQDKLDTPGPGGLRAGILKNIPNPPPVGTFTLYLDNPNLKDLWIALTWGTPAAHG